MSLHSYPPPWIQQQAVSYSYHLCEQDECSAYIVWAIRQRAQVLRMNLARSFEIHSTCYVRARCLVKSDATDNLMCVIRMCSATTAYVARIRGRRLWSRVFVVSMNALVRVICCGCRNSTRAFCSGVFWFFSQKRPWVIFRWFERYCIKQYVIYKHIIQSQALFQAHPYCHSRKL
jgi:hypothetical protein